MTLRTVSVPCITQPSPPEYRDHLCPFALIPAFPDLTTMGTPSPWGYEVGRRARCQIEINLVVPGDPLPNRTGPFPSIRLSSDYCVSVAVGCPSWIAVWQVAQTTNVFLRLLAIS